VAVAVCVVAVTVWPKVPVPLPAKTAEAVTVAVTVFARLSLRAPKTFSNPMRSFGPNFFSSLRFSPFCRLTSTLTSKPLTQGDELVHLTIKVSLVKPMSTRSILVMIGPPLVQVTAAAGVVGGRIASPAGANPNINPIAADSRAAKIIFGDGMRLFMIPPSITD
jgi:hypothetical protein